MAKLRELYKYRELIYTLVKRDLRGRYKGSVLGFLWSFLNPLLQLCIYTMVFSIVVRSGIEKYYLFLFVALVPWLCFSSSMVVGAGCIVAHKNMVQKMRFPREVIPVASVTGNFADMIFGLMVVMGVIIFTGYGIRLVTLLFLPVVIAVEYIFALGIVIITSAVTVYLRDIQYIMRLIMMAWQFLSPIMYSRNTVPPLLQIIFKLNPISPVIEAYRDILYYKTIPHVEGLFYPLIIGILCLVFGEMLFSRLQKWFAEEL